MPDWKNEIIPKVRDALEERHQQGITTITVRGIFYLLVSLDLIENLQQRYKDLLKALVTARRNGVIPYDWIVDESRGIIDIDYDVYMEPWERIRRTLEGLIDLRYDYKDTIPRWYKQPKYVEVWVEKNAMADVFSSILTDSRQIRIVPNGGWASETFMRENLRRVERGGVHREYDYENDRIRFRDVYVLYYGDYDPTGLRMVENLQAYLEEIHVNFEHVAITKEQIEDFGLGHLTNPDPSVMAKLERDSNAAAFREENDGQLFQVELDALNALRPDDFISLLEEKVDRHFDERIYNEVMDDPQHSSKTIWRQVRNSIKNFDKYVKIYEEQLEKAGLVSLNKKKDERDED